jgi:hypothetical protein
MSNRHTGGINVLLDPHSATFTQSFSVVISTSAPQVRASLATLMRSASAYA